jgi:hypothetical protein
MRADRVVSIVLWVLVFKIAVWTIVAAMFGWVGEDTVRLAMVALFPLSTLAAVLQVRLYAVRMCSMIRATAGREHGPDLHALP